MAGKFEINKGLRIVAGIVLALAVLPVLMLTGCQKSPGEGPDAEDNTPGPTELPKEETVVTSDDNYVNSVKAVNTVLRAVDNLDRRLLTEDEVPAKREGKYVGIFYFQWLGMHGLQLYDNSIISQVPGALESEKGWIAAGGGKVNDFHFWGKPMFGYYTSSDKWVMRKHVQMLTDAGIDFLCFDTSNANGYEVNAIALMTILQEYYDQGWDVPKVCFLTNTRSGETMKSIYKLVYKKHPEFENIWFKWDGKPMIIGRSEEASDELKEFFRIKESQWPMEDKNDDGFPWMEFDRLLTDDAVYGLNGRKEVVNVSLAQHNETYKMSAVSWYGSNDRSRSWHDGANDPAPDAYLYGYNFAEQFEWALSVDPEIIFITGWNEWVAQRQPATYQGPVENNGPIVFLDNASLNGSRDIEPMEGGYGDNYYMQMISLIRRFKGVTAEKPRNNRTIDVNGGFAQWNDIAACYRDYTGDTADRKARGWGKENYTDDTGRNDIEEMKVCEDDANVYFFVKTASDITAPEGETWMNLFIGGPDLTTDSSWNGYRYVLNYNAPDKDGLLYLGTLGDSASYSVTPCAEVRYRLHANMLMVEIPKSVIGLTPGETASTALVFKWADNCTKGDVYGLYMTGDAAPIGRAGFYYGK
ncbi:MAG: hypothetical protein IJS71_10345 [Clostridia bacterium]|nr:hypothetical protein [Clostridia bacterium]